MMKARIEWTKRRDLPGQPMQLFVTTDSKYYAAVALDADDDGAVEWRQFSSMVEEVTHALARLEKGQDDAK